MAGFIPTCRVPHANICQDIQNGRTSELNEEVDIQLPVYLIDRRILRAIELKSLNYLASYLKQCPRNMERYFFLETVTSLSPLVRSVVISNLLGFAILYRSPECLKMLLEHSSDPFQATYFIEWMSNGDNEKKILLYEAPAFVLLSSSLYERYRVNCVDMLRELRLHETELHVPIALRKQHIEYPNELVSTTTRFPDAWECLEREVDKKGGAEVEKSKLLLRELKAVYRSNKFDHLEKPAEKEA